MPYANTYQPAFFAAQYRFIASDCLALCSGVRNVAALLAAIVVSVFSVLWKSRIGLFGSRSASRRRCFSSSVWIARPFFSDIRAALYAGSAHLAFIFSRTSGRLAGFASPEKSAIISGERIRLDIFSRDCAFRAGWFGSNIACRNFSRCSGVGE